MTWGRGVFFFGGGAICDFVEKALGGEVHLAGGLFGEDVDLGARGVTLPLLSSRKSVSASGRYACGGIHLLLV